MLVSPKYRKKSLIKKKLLVTNCVVRIRYVQSVEKVGAFFKCGVHNFKLELKDTKNILEGTQQLKKLLS